jgi:para-aminobenzoate synthetase component 1
MHVVEIAYREPVEAAAALAALPLVTFLDSAMADPRQGRYAFVAGDPFGCLRATGDRVTWNGTPQHGDPFAVLGRLMARFRVDTIAGLPPFQCGAAGVFSYELATCLERLPRPQRDDLAFPDLSLLFHDAVVAFDLIDRRAWVLSTGLPETDPPARRARAIERAAALVHRIDEAAPPQRRAACPPHVTNWRSNFSRAEYERAVARVVEYILAGDIFQANIAQRFTAPLPADFDYFGFYRQLRTINPAPFAAYLDHGDFVIASASPERFLQVLDGRVETRPIKGTAPRDPDPDRDARNAAALLASRKDRAENVMIVDLLRNDLSRVCRPGTIEVPQLCGLESFAGVHHLVSAVTGTLSDGRGPVDLIAAAFPGGSITGAPKLRATEIIAEIEQHARGPYCGAIGYLGFDGSMDTSIVIRTAAFRNGTGVVQAGGGVVAASDPAAEYDETLVKARRMFDAFGASQAFVA